MMNKTVYKLMALVMVFILLMCVSGCGVQDEEVLTPVDSYPERDITIILPLGAGGTSDLTSRDLAVHWSKKLGVELLVKNVPGSGGQLGMMEFYTSTDAEEGYAIQMITLETAIGTMLMGAEYTLDDFAFINRFSYDVNGIVVAANSPYQTLDDLIKAVKEKPGMLAYGIQPSTSSALFAKIFLDTLGLDILSVDYGSGGEIRLATVAGETDMHFGLISGDVAYGPDLRILAVAADAPVSFGPDIPLINDLLEPYGVTVPTTIGANRFWITRKEFKENYPERFNLLVETHKATLEDEEYKQALKDTGFEPFVTYIGPEESEKLAREVYDTIMEFKEWY